MSGGVSTWGRAVEAMAGNYATYTWEYVLNLGIAIRRYDSHDLTALTTSRPRDRWCDPGRTDDENFRLQNAQDAEKRGQRE